MSNLLNIFPKRTSDQVFSMVRLNRGFFALVHGRSEYLREQGALYLAKNYLCLGTRDEDCPCSSCRRIDDEHPDLLIRTPSASGNLLVGDTDACISFLEESSMVTGKKCVILKGVDRLTPAAVGGLLKILEESVPQASIILTATSESKVTPTLRSRCQRVFVGDDTRGSLYIRLSDSGSNTKTSEELSRVGTMLSLDVVDNKDLVVEAHKAIPAIVQNMLKGKTVAALTKYSEYASKAKAEGLQALSDMMVSTFVDVQKVTFTAASHINMPSRLEWLTSMRDEVPEGVIESAVNAFRRVSNGPPNHRRAMIVWAICAVCEEVNLHKEKA
jgi:hypothetical protein